MNDCHGDTYDVFPLGPVAYYSVSHAHYCADDRRFPNTNPLDAAPRARLHDLPDRDEHRAGRLRLELPGLARHPSVLTLVPDSVPGAYTGQGQAGLVGRRQQQLRRHRRRVPVRERHRPAGLVRFAASSIAPNKVGPTKSPVVAPTAISVVSGQARVSWAAAWDMDNATSPTSCSATATATPVYTMTKDSSFWHCRAWASPTPDVAAGSTHTYRLEVDRPVRQQGLERGLATR